MLGVVILSFFMKSEIILSVVILKDCMRCHYAVCCYTECFLQDAILLIVIILSGFMQGVIMLIVVLSIFMLIVTYAQSHI